MPIEILDDPDWQRAYKPGAEFINAHAGKPVSTDAEWAANLGTAQQEIDLAAITAAASKPLPRPDVVWERAYKAEKARQAREEPEMDSDDRESQAELAGEDAVWTQVKWPALIRMARCAGERALECAHFASVEEANGSLRKAGHGILPIRSVGKHARALSGNGARRH